MCLYNSSNNSLIFALLMSSRKHGISFTYTRICTILVLGAYYGLTHYDWPGVHLRELDFWSLLVILAIGAYALIWAAVAYQLNRVDKGQFGDSYMLSMLYTDSQQPPLEDMVGIKPPPGKKPN